MTVSFDTTLPGMAFSADAGALITDGPSAEATETSWGKEEWFLPIPRVRMLVRYQDGTRAVTDRAIEIVRAYGHDEERSQIVRVYAFCHLRRQMRSFRLDRIDYAADGDTGEIIPAVGPWLIKHQALRPPEGKS